VKEEDKMMVDIMRADIQQTGDGPAEASKLENIFGATPV
jgi:hypothetical protein